MNENRPRPIFEVAADLMRTNHDIFLATEALRGKRPPPVTHPIRRITTHGSPAYQQALRDVARMKGEQS